MQTQCSVKDCGKLVAQKGMCWAHYYRMHRHGSLDNPRPEGWGSKKKHPLYETWYRIKRIGPICDAWRDFWVFARDVNAKPSEDFVFARERETEPYGPANYFWREKLFLFRNSTDKKAARTEYMKHYRKLRPELFREADLKKNFGIRTKDYELMMELQDNVCAICRGVNTVIDRRTGEPRRLAVDHDHATGKVRGLLCQHCNQGLGCFKDNTQTLQAAVDYLNSYKDA